MLDERSSKASRSVIIILVGGIICLLGFLTMILVGFDVLSNGYHIQTLITAPLVSLLGFLTMYTIGPQLNNTVDSMLFAIAILAAVLGSIAGLHFIIAKQVSSGKIQKRIVIYAFVIFDLLVFLAFFLGVFLSFFLTGTFLRL